VACPTPFASGVVELGHGGGGRQGHRLVDEIFRKAFASPGPRAANIAAARPDAALLVDGTQHDSAVLKIDASEIAFTTDAYVVTPLFFPGGDIGKIAALGTLNDLAVVGAKPLALSASFILEEGLALDDLRKITESMARAAHEQQIRVVTGDTKVVERGRGDGIYISTSGLGQRQAGADWQPSRIQPGDAILVSGDLGRHGMAILSVREGLRFDGAVESDCAPLWPLVQGLLPIAQGVHCLRDLTRGGLGAALNELCRSSQTRFSVDEASLPVCEAVSSACELLGLDPIVVANEGRFVAFVSQTHAEQALAALRAHPTGSGACQIGRVLRASSAGEPGAVELVSRLGTRRPLEWQTAEQLPRIC
jgi:hydrogenase expression/formation protein HypE